MVLFCAHMTFICHFWKILDMSNVRCYNASPFVLLALMQGSKIGQGKMSYPRFPRTLLRCHIV